MKVLIIEDDQKTARFIEKGFSEAGMTVDVCYDGNEGLDRLLLHDYDVAVVDVMLPGLHGLELIETLREEGNQTPVLILSAKRSVSERIDGIRSGGDDYLVKPFSFSELVVRVQALVRRSSPPQGLGNSDRLDRLSFANLELDSWSREAFRDGKSVPLHPRELSLLEYFMRNRDRVLSKTSILDRVYGYDFDPQTNVVDVLVFRLRSKIDKGYSPKLIHTVRGMGYIMKVED